MSMVADLKNTRQTARNVALVCLGILIPVAITVVSFGAKLSSQIAVLDAGWRENRGRIERIESKVDVIVDKVHEALDSHEQERK